MPRETATADLDVHAFPVVARAKNKGWEVVAYGISGSSTHASAATWVSKSSRIADGMDPVMVDSGMSIPVRKSIFYSESAAAGH